MVVLTASLLWDICCRESHAPIRRSLLDLSQKNPDTFRILVVNHLDPREYAMDVHKYVPWSLEAHCRLFETDTTRLPSRRMAKTDTSTKAAASELSWDEYDWMYDAMLHAKNKEERSFLGSYRSKVREYYLLYPTSRTPVFPLHFALHGSQVMAPSDVLEPTSELEEQIRSRSDFADEKDAEDNVKGDVLMAESVENEERTFSSIQPSPVPLTWFFYVKQAINHPAKQKGVTLVCLWEAKAVSNPTEEYRRRRRMETAIYEKLVLESATAADMVTWLRDSLIDASGIFHSLLSSYTGEFLVLSGPTGGFMLTNLPNRHAASAAVRVYTCNEQYQLPDCRTERPSSMQTALLLAPSSSIPSSWVTYRMDALEDSERAMVDGKSASKGERSEGDVVGTQGLLELTVGLGVREVEGTEAMMKYLILGNRMFWSYISAAGIDALNQLRSMIEEQLFSRPVEDLVTESWSGPIGIDELYEQVAIDAAEEQNQFKLISVVDSWLQLHRMAIRKLLASQDDPKADVTVAAIISISLEDSDNWNYWESRLKDQNQGCLDRLTSPDSVPRRYIKHAKDVEELQSHLAITDV